MCRAARPGAVLRTTRQFPDVIKALPVDFAATTGFSAATGGTSQTTGPGRVLGLPPEYAQAFPGQIRVLAGRGTGTLLYQQTAANLRARPGDVVTVDLGGGHRGRVRVDGVVDLPAIDSLFQQVGAPAGAQPQAPPDNVVLLPQIADNVLDKHHGRLCLFVLGRVVVRLRTSPRDFASAANP